MKWHKTWVCSLHFMFETALNLSGVRLCGFSRLSARGGGCGSLDYMCLVSRHFGVFFFFYIYLWFCPNPLAFFPFINGKNPKSLEVSFVVFLLLKDK